MASTYLTKSFASSGNRKKFTFSMWVKRGNIGNSFCIFNQHYSSNNNNSYIGFNSDDTLSFWSYSSSYQMNLKTNAKYRDTNGWYHIVCVADTAQGTSSNRAKLYVNGEEPTLGTATYPSQNLDLNFNSDETQQIGIYRYGSSNYYFYDGCLSHFHFTDGYAYAASDFGETDSTTGEWKIKTDPNVQYGSNGHFILKDSNSITDQSGNGVSLTTSGTITKSEDNPSNSFCTWNTNHRGTRKDMTLTNGNTFIYEQNSGDSAVSGTIAVSSGKWYWEQKAAQVTGTNFVVIGGLHTVEDFSETPTSLNQNNTVGMRDTGNVFKGTSDLGNFTSAVYNGDVFGIGFDADNGSMYFWRNGSPLNSGNAIVTGLDMTKTWTPFGVQHGGARVSTSTNFGNGYFQTTAVSSAGTNASGNGIFEYDVPSGYTALSTKGLNL